MAVNIKKYNPGFLTDEELVSAFCIRRHEFDSILESLHLCTGSSNVHTIVIGPRGSGKTHLLLRVAAQVRQDATLAGIFPIVFAEESYEVTTCGEFWLECLNRLSDQAPASDRNALRLSYNEIQATPDDLTLQDRCLGALLDFANRRGQRLLLIAENLHMLFADMVDSNVGWQLRHTLQTEPRIIFLGSATCRFAEIDSSQHALYDLFRTITLSPLDTDECTRLWCTISGHSGTPRTIRSLEILTGGNPRLLVIIAHGSKDRSFRELMSNLLDLVDEHTEYFKSHLEALPPQERRVYLALARIWKPAAAREIAVQARLNTSHCSALLQRLIQRGVAAIEEGETARQRRYYLTERLYNVYYLLRRGGAEAAPVRTLISFMICLYLPSELSDILKSLSKDARAADALPAHIAVQIQEALFNESISLIQAKHLQEGFDLFIAVTHYIASGFAPVHELKENVDLVAELLLTLMNMKVTEHLSSQKAANLVAELLQIFARGQDSAGIAACDKLVRQFGTRTEPQLPIVEVALYAKAKALSRQSNYSEALDAFNQVLARKQTIEKPELDFSTAYLIYQKGILLWRCHRTDEALAVFDQIIGCHHASDKPEWSSIIASTIATKSLILSSEGRHPISEAECAIAFQCWSQENNLPSIYALCSIVASMSVERALELIQASPASSLLLPLTTALQQELGQRTPVAKEVEEVAADIRRELADQRDWLQQIRRHQAPALDEPARITQFSSMVPNTINTKK